MTSQLLSCDSNPAHRPTVERLTGIKRRVRTIRRLQLVFFQWIYELTGARHALSRIRTHVETRSAPGKFGHCRPDLSSLLDLVPYIRMPPTFSRVVDPFKDRKSVV